MSKTLKTILYILGGILLVLTLGFFILKAVLTNKIETFVHQELPKNMEADYKTLDLNLWSGGAYLTSPTIVIKNQGTGQVHTNISADTLQLTQLDYWGYLFKDKVKLSKFSLEHPVVLHYPHLVGSDSASSGSSTNLKNRFLIDTLALSDASLTIYDSTQDSVALHSPSVNLSIRGISLDSTTISAKIPFNYTTFSVGADSIFAKTSPYENTTVGSLSVENRTATLTKVRLKTKYSRAKHARLLEKERDHFDLEIDEIHLGAIDFGFRDAQFFFGSSHLEFKSPNLNIFRNKLVADAPTTKPLYSEMLRKLPFQLSIDSASISNANIRYTEKVNENTQGGTLTFSNLNAAISNLGNTYGEGENTTLDISAQFMEEAPVQVTWTFDVNNASDAFTFKADVGHLNASELNKFTEPNLFVRLQGDAQQTYFTINGNAESSQIDFKIKYDEFKVKVLEKGESDKKWLISTFANLLLSDNSNSADNDFKDGSAQVERVENKSFFNYLWLNVRAGLKATLM